MVASANSDPYTPFPQGIILEEGPQSSEEGSGLHSPIFGAPFPPPHGDSSLRYHHQDQLDVHHAAGILASQFDYHAVPPLNVQQHPLLDTTLDAPSPAHHHRVSYHSDFPLPSRSHLGLDFPGHLPRLSSPPHIGHGDYAFHSTRLPGGQSHEQSSYRSIGNPGMPMDGDHKSSATRRNSYSTIAPSSPREQRKEISTVVIACHQCRARKIRCDSTRPVCNNCLRRSNECHYDTVPKRRGPDKRPGTRQRSCKKRPSDGSAPLPPSKRKRSAKLDEPVIARSKPVTDSTHRSSSRHDHHIDGLRPNRVPRASPPSDLATSQISSLQRGAPMATPPPTSRHPPYPYGSNNFVRSLNGQLDVKTQSEQDDKENNHYASPPPAVVEYNQKVWDNLLGTYSLNAEQSLKDIVADLSFLFSNTSYWLSFVNPLFLQSLYTDERLQIQPSFVFAGLAMATLMKSSENELGETGRNRALWLRDAAQRHLESSWSSQRVDPTLAEAALVLALFESSVHPLHSPERVASSLVFLDNIIRAQSLTYIDAQDPDVSVFGSQSVPIVNDSSVGLEAASKKAHPARQYERKCTCILPDTKLPVDHLSRYWSCSLPWDSSWSPAEVRKEECRRLCWSALNIVSSYTSQCAALNKTPPELFLSNPANFALLFPGEALDRRSPDDRSSDLRKESIWALYCRCMLLWNFCDRLRDKSCGEEDKAEYALEAWAETQAIQDALDMHNCNLNTSLIYMSREYLNNTRMTITHSLRRFVPSSENGANSPDCKPAFSRKQAEEWLYYQDQVIRRVKASIHEPQGRLVLTRRPFQVTWFSNQLAICLSLWEHDHSLLNALELGKSILGIVDILTSLWPCPSQQSRCDELKEKLVDACTAVHLRLPHPPDGSLSPLLRAR